jgi:hypothetical protein
MDRAFAQRLTTSSWVGCHNKAATYQDIGAAVKTKRFIVFYLKGGRIGSVPLTSRNKTEARACMRLSKIKTDAGGTEHYNILGVNRDCRL